MERAWFGCALAALAMAAVALLVACGGRRRRGGGCCGFFRCPAPMPGATTVTLNGTATFDSVPNADRRAELCGHRGQAGSRRRGRSRQRRFGGGAGHGDHRRQRRLFRFGAREHIHLPCGSRRRCCRPAAGASWDVTCPRQHPVRRHLRDGNAARSSSGERSAHARCPCAFRLGRLELRARPASRRLSRVLDTIYAAQAKVLSVAPSTAFPPLRVFWSVNNVPASGNPAHRARSARPSSPIRPAGRVDLRAGQGERRYRRIRPSGRRARMGSLLPVRLQPRRFARRQPFLERASRSAPGLLRGLGQRLVGHRAGTQQLHRFDSAPAQAQGSNLNLTRGHDVQSRLVPRGLDPVDPVESEQPGRLQADP